MKLPSADRVDITQKSFASMQAGVRIPILPLISFLLGVWVTVLWFQFGPDRHVEKSNSQASSAQMNSTPASEQPINQNQPSRPYVPSHPPVDSTIIEKVRQAIPNYASVSLADGIQILREAALKQFTAASKDTDARVKQARQQVIQAQKESAADLAAARKHLQEVQLAAAEKLQQIAAELQTQIAALKQLKGTTQ